jgi:hypothetical protein
MTCGAKILSIFYTIVLNASFYFEVRDLILQLYETCKSLYVNNHDT